MTSRIFGSGSGRKSKLLRFSFDLVEIRHGGGGGGGGGLHFQTLEMSSD